MNKAQSMKKKAAPPPVFSSNGGGIPLAPLRGGFAGKAKKQKAENLQIFDF
jgi:hypothetical protein